MKNNSRSNLSVLLRILFVNRTNTYAQQNEDGSYMRIEQPLTDYIVGRHLAGVKTVGPYQLNEKSHTKTLCFDFDPEHLDKPRETAEKILVECLNKPRPETPRFYRQSVLVEASRYPDSSFHIWILFVPSIPAKVARWLGQ